MPALEADTTAGGATEERPADGSAAGTGAAAAVAAPPRSRRQRHEGLIRRLAAGLEHGLRFCLPAIAAGLAASIPIIDSAARAVRAGWVPAGDDGIIATRGWDVLTSHTPLVGQYSEAGLVIHGQVMHSPGPMLYWLLALPARYGSVASLAVAMAALNTLSVIGCVLLARRRGGLVLMLMSAAAIALMCQSLPTEALHDIWNPAAALFPFLLLVFLCWSLACGDRWLLPAIALVASYVTQTHLMYAAPTAVVLVVGVGGLLLGRFARPLARTPGRLWLRVRARRSASAATRSGRAPTPTHAPTPTPTPAPAPAPASGEAPPEGVGAGETVVVRSRPPRIWPWALAALLVAAACWTEPAIDQIENNPGNLAMIVRTAEHRGPTLGASVGWHAVVRSVEIRPWWLYVPASEWERKHDVLAAPGTRALDSALAILAALALVGLAGALARRFDLTAAALIGLGLCAAIGLEAASNPSARLLAETLGYTMWWGSEVGMWVWLVIAWALWLGLAGLGAACLRAARRRLGERGRWGPRAAAIATACATLAGLAGLFALGNAVAATARPDSHVYEYRSISAAAAAIERAIPPRQTIAYHLGPLGVGTQPMEPAIRFLLVRHGDRVLANGSLPRLGPYYEQYDRPVQWVVYLTDARRPAAHMQLAARVRFSSPWGAQTLSAWIRREAPRAPVAGHRRGDGPRAATYPSRRPSRTARSSA